MRGIPIDFDRATYLRARTSVLSEQQPRDEGKEDDEVFFEAYYDEQYEMLRTLKPRVVGHFDLVRLLSDHEQQAPEKRAASRDVRTWKGVWERIVRNLRVVVESGAWLECNTSALRKGLSEPYPCRAIAEVSVQAKELYSVLDMASFDAETTF